MDSIAYRPVRGCLPAACQPRRPGSRSAGLAAGRFWPWLRRLPAASAWFSDSAVGRLDCLPRARESETDRFGRLLRYVWLRITDADGADAWLMVNLELVRDAFAAQLLLVRHVGREADRAAPPLLADELPICVAWRASGADGCLPVNGGSRA